MAGLRLPDHSHCLFCGDPIPFGEEYCDEECRRSETERVRKEKNKERLFWVSATVITLAIVIAGIVLKF